MGFLIKLYTLKNVDSGSDIDSRCNELAFQLEYVGIIPPNETNKIHDQCLLQVNNAQLV